MRAKPRTRRAVTIAAALLLVSAIAGYTLRPEVIDVETGTAMRGPMRVTIDETGRTRVRSRFVIAAPVSGRLERSTLHEGDPVSPGQIVAWIAPPPMDSAAHRIAAAHLRSALALQSEAASRVSQAKLTLEQARNTERRREALMAAGAISPEQREQAVVESRLAAGELQSAASRLRAANADVVAARAALLPAAGGTRAAVPVRSPARGDVLRVVEQSERVIPASTPIIELGDAGELEVIADFLSSDAVRLASGYPVEIVEWGGESPLTGRVRRIEPSAFTSISALGIEEQRVNVLVDLLEVPKSLGDGFRVEVRATIWEGRDVLMIPSSAVIQRGGKWSTFVKEHGRARLRDLEIGHRSGATVEITSGLQAGETVILFPSDRVEEGSRVR